MLTLLLILSSTIQWPSQLVAHPAPIVGEDEAYGAGVAIDGDTAVVGAPGGAFIPGDGRVYVFARGPGGWTTVQTIEHPQPSSLPSIGANFGVAIDLEGDLLAIGDSVWSGFGAGGRAWFYRRVGGSFVLEGDTGFIPPSGSYLGSSVSVDEASGRIAVGAGSYDPTGMGGIGVGGIWIYEDTGTGWAQVAELVPSTTVTTTSFAEGMALHGDLLLAGHWRHGSPVGTGGVFVFERVNGVWVETDVIGPVDPEGTEQFGSSLAFDGTTLLVGAPGKNNFVGTVQAFQREADGSFTFQQEIVPAHAEPSMGYGRGLALQGNLALVGAPRVAPAEVYEGGRVDVLTRQAGNWAEVCRLTDPHPGPMDLLGYWLALDGTRVVIGNPYDDWVGTNTGSALFFDLSPTGLVYCTAGSSAAGCAAQLTTSGQPSATAPSGFTVAAQDLEGQRDGLFFFGTSGRQASPWGNGTSYQCVAPPVVRTPLLTGSGTLGSCDGTLARDLNALWCPGCPSPAKNPGAGAVVQAQLWYRDPGSTSNQTTGLSDAVEFHLAP